VVGLKRGRAAQYKSLQKLPQNGAQWPSRL
jgi:hypothetical protein